MERVTTSVSAISAPAHHDTAEGPPGLLALIARRFANWLKRRRIGRIEQLDDRMLKDIGVTRADLVWARSLSLDQNPLAALEGARSQRRVARYRALREAARAIVKSPG